MRKKKKRRTMLEGEQGCYITGEDKEKIEERKGDTRREIVLVYNSVRMKRKKRGRKGDEEEEGERKEEEGMKVIWRG